MWYWRSMEKISYTGRVKNKVFHMVKGDRSILHGRTRRKADWKGYALRSRPNCLLNHIIEDNTEIRSWRGRRRKQLLDDFKEKTDTEIWGMKH
jgi:hypothetical protein